MAKMEKEKTLKYAFFDGDNVGNTIDNLLNSGRVQEATHLSESIKSAIFQIELFVRSTENAKVIISGGDDVLIEYAPEKSEGNFLQSISQIFTNHTGLSISCGAGNSVVQAILNLENVKSREKGATISNTVDDTAIQTYRRKQTRLYIFTSSNVPDPHINVIYHCAVNYDNLENITLIDVVVDKGKIAKIKDRLEALKGKIRKQLRSLSEGRYSKEVNGTWEDKEIDISRADMRKYSELSSLPINTDVLVYDNSGYRDLEGFVSELSKIEGSIQNIIDVTTMIKSYMVDIYALLRFHNISTIHSFELFTERRFYDERELIHNLTLKKTYDYPCLSESAYTRDKIVVGQTSTTDAINANCERLEEKISVNFAQFWFMIYILSLTPALVLFIRYLNQPEGWDKAEPLAFVITLVWYLLNCFLQVLFTGGFPSLDPRELFHILKIWKKHRLERFRMSSRNS